MDLPSDGRLDDSPVLHLDGIDLLPETSIALGYDLLHPSFKSLDLAVNLSPHLKARSLFASIGELRLMLRPLIAPVVKEPHSAEE